MPICCIYWQMILREFIQVFPETKTFTSRWLQDSSIPNCTLDIEVVGKLKVWQLKKQYTSYGTKIAFMSPTIVGKIFAYQPQIIFADTFCLWTLLILFIKPIGKWKVILSYEGSSPGVDYRNSFLRLLVRKYMARKADALVTNTNAGKKYLVEVLKANKNKVFTYSYFVPNSKLFQLDNVVKSVDKATILSSNIRPIFIFIGRLIPRKGVKDLLKACAILKQQNYSNYLLLIVGQGEQQAELISFCKKWNLDQQVKWIGPINYKMIFSYLQLADILILPSIEDTWGMVVIEAILAGKAVFCSHRVGASEIINREKNGCVFEPKNPEVLANLMKNVINDPNTIITMNQKSKNIASQYSPRLGVDFLTRVANFVDS